MKIFKPSHAEPGSFWLDYILLPYGEFYSKTRDLLSAKKGDVLRYFNGGEYPIDSVHLITQDRVCDVLCRMRYGISIVAALRKWRDNARIEGNGPNVISDKQCILVVLDKDVTV